jgi:hypothetical protein
MYLSLFLYWGTGPLLYNSNQCEKTSDYCKGFLVPVEGFASSCCLVYPDPLVPPTAPNTFILVIILVIPTVAFSLFDMDSPDLSTREYAQ